MAASRWAVGCGGLILLGGIAGAAFIVGGEGGRPDALRVDPLRVAQAEGARAERARFDAMSPRQHAAAAEAAMGPPSRGTVGQLEALRHLEAVRGNDPVARATVERVATELQRRRGERRDGTRRASHPR